MKKMGFLACALSVATTKAIELFVTGAAAGISLYCGVKMPKNKR